MKTIELQTALIMMLTCYLYAFLQILCMYQHFRRIVAIKELDFQIHFSYRKIVDSQISHRVKRYRNKRLVSE